MPGILKAVIDIDHDITRHFDFDYLIFDALFLAAFVIVLIRRQRYTALKAGLICGGVLYLIDGVIWVATGVREYEISARWVKVPVDFMMDVSYGIVAFGWVWIAFEQKSVRDVGFWTLFLYGGWLLVPLFSKMISLYNDPIVTVRHMQSQVLVQMAAVLGGYVLLLILGYDVRTMLYVLWVGMMLAFMMESSLMLWGIRPLNLQVLAYETLVLTNQGVPYFLVIKDRILPALRVSRDVCGRATTGR